MMKQRDMRGGHYAAELEPTGVYRERRRRLSSLVGGGTVVCWGNGDDRGAGDVGTFRQNSDFYYLTGVELPNAILVLRPAEEKDYLFLPARDPDIEKWTGPKFGPGEETAAVLGFDEVLPVGSSQVTLDARIRPRPGFIQRLQSWLAEDGGMLHTVFPEADPDADPDVTHRFVEKLRRSMVSFGVGDISGVLASMRYRKSPGEVALMRRAIDATIEGHRAAAAGLEPGSPEGLIEGVVYAAFRRAGAEGTAFPSIVGSGFNATTLHYDQNACLCGDGDVVVIDIGARYGYYCGDLTRSYPVSGNFSPRQRELYLLVAEAHDKVAEAMKPGLTLFDLRKIAYGVFQDSPLRDSRGERLGQYFIHGLGHHLGLDAHDPGSDYLVLEPGMVITNEPGLYLPDEAIGIRIEDDHVITPGGNENLSAVLPVSPEEIEAMVGTKS